MQGPPSASNGTRMNRDARATQDMLPPKDHKVEVRVLSDYGELFSRDGPLILSRNTVHFMWREDAQPLIAEGIVEEVAQ